MSETKNIKPEQELKELKKQKKNNYKKFLLYSILLVLVVLVGYVLFSEDKQMYTLLTDTRNKLIPDTTTESSSNTNLIQTKSFLPTESILPTESNLSTSKDNSNINLFSPTSSPNVSMDSALSKTSVFSGGASEVRRELRELFHEYNKLNLIK